MFENCRQCNYSAPPKLMRCAPQSSLHWPHFYLCVRCSYRTSTKDTAELAELEWNFDKSEHIDELERLNKNLLKESNKQSIDNFHENDDLKKALYWFNFLSSNKYSQKSNSGINIVKKLWCSTCEKPVGHRLFDCPEYLKNKTLATNNLLNEILSINEVQIQNLEDLSNVDLYSKYQKNHIDSAFQSVQAIKWLLQESGVLMMNLKKR